LRQDANRGCRINPKWCTDVTMAKDKVLRDVLRLIGGTRALARELGIDHAAVSRWERVPPLRVLEVERITGVSRYRLRPDVYGRAPPEK